LNGYWVRERLLISCEIETQSIPVICNISHLHASHPILSHISFDERTVLTALATPTVAVLVGKYPVTWPGMKRSKQSEISFLLTPFIFLMPLLPFPDLVFVVQLVYKWMIPRAIEQSSEIHQHLLASSIRASAHGVGHIPMASSWCPHQCHFHYLQHRNLQ
jgi:hypothetical protein